MMRHDEIGDVLWELTKKLNHLHEASVISLAPKESFALGAASGFHEQIKLLRQENEELQRQIDGLEDQKAM